MESNCAECRWRQHAERKPKSFLGRLWRWHTKWCPGWKAYQAELAEREAESSAEPDRVSQ
ncbi:MAG: hypothetical protein SYC29_15190 [Planctomycetota bacterium]|nr:hypothetical protein [Planctomycetota bacterium]